MTKRPRITFRSRPPQPAAFAAVGGPVAAEPTEKLVVEGVLAPRDEIIFLLQTAAEIEQSLLVQYLYAAYSIDPDSAPTPADRTKAVGWQFAIINIAVEEMAHLISMQNLLLFVGGPTNLDREDFPYRDQFYPFHFKLEPISLDSLAKYVVAEMPEIAAPDPKLREIIRRATVAHSGMTPNRVGALFERILVLLNDDDFPESDTFPDTASTLQAKPGEWRSGGGRIVRTVATLKQAKGLANDIAVQGEGGDMAPTSHYQKFRMIYEEYEATTAWNPSRPMPVDPNTSEAADVGGPDAEDDADLEAGRITNEESRRWAHLVDLRYRLLLHCIAHSLDLPSEQSDERSAVLRWAFLAMEPQFSSPKTGIRSLIIHLQSLPQHDPPQRDEQDREKKAGPPFAMPCSLALPNGDNARWRTYINIVDITDEILSSTMTNPDLRDNLKLINQDIRDQATTFMSSTSDAPVTPTEPPVNPGDGSQAKVDFLDLLKSKRGIAQFLHGGVEVPAGGSLNDLFSAENYDAIINFLTTSDAVRPPVVGKPLVVPGSPSQSGFYIQIMSGVMAGRFTGDEVKVVERWIRSLPSASGGARMRLAAVAAGTGGIVANHVATGLTQPLFVTAPPNDHNRLFIVEKTGAIKIMNLGNGQVLPVPLLQIDDLSSSGERGLLGLAFHPEFADNGHFFVNFTDATGRTNVRRYTAIGNTADPSSRHDVITVDQPFSNHNGGWIDFGPTDGFLYIALGDGGFGNDPDNNAQNLNSLLGKMLRIDIDRDDLPAAPTRSYGIPPSNPFVSDQAARSEIWALGLRNPWRCSFDRLTADLWIADVGQSGREEINFQNANSRGGENYGWRIREGTQRTGLDPDVGTFVDPIHEYGRTDGGAIIGGYVHRGEAMDGLRGTYFYADFLSNRIWSLRFDGSSISNHMERTAELNANQSLAAINSFGQDGRGEIYIVSMTGDIYRIETV